MELQEILQRESVVIPDLGIARCDNFSQVYASLNYYLVKYKEYQDSRDGRVKEILDFKTHITNPYRRCVGGYRRDMNVFFLLAEAMWIVMGRKDVEFLTIFNKNMAKFSDDGTVFHAPYGFRLRHWGVRSEDMCEGDYCNKGYDQVVNAIRLFQENPNTRQVVMNIWNPTFDLGFKTKDIPCNDIVMLKIREGKLITTIANRSNDLHWGLPTNIFQFSFLTEIMAACLGVELGTQTHNSQSLHLYEWNDIANTMFEEYERDNGNRGLYSVGAREIPIDFNFTHDVPINRFREVEYHLQIIIDNIMRIAHGEAAVEDEIAQLARFSKYLTKVYYLLWIYVLYKQKITEDGVDKDAVRESFIAEIYEVCEKDWDVAMLACNFFASRLSNNTHEIIGTL